MDCDKKLRLMHLSFLPYLVDPETLEPLELKVKRREGDVVLEGTLSSTARSYPIVRGIPRFAGYGTGGDYSRSFGYQWNRWRRVQFESENVGKPMQGHTLRMWQRITAVGSDDLEGQIIGDFGCGSGRFIEVVRLKKGKVIGLDLSQSVEAAADCFRQDPQVLICQADILSPPIKPASLDGAFSIGVLHHTPAPEKAFAAMAETVKRRGWISVSVYGKGGYYDFPTVKLYRRLFQVLWPWCRHYPPLAYAYFATYMIRPLSNMPVLGPLLRVVFPCVRLPDATWSLLDTFDSVTPAYQSAHESYEVFQWFKQCGLADIEPSDWGFTAYHGRKVS